MNTSSRRDTIKSLQDQIQPLITEKVMLAARLSVEVAMEQEKDRLYVYARQIELNRYHDLTSDLWHLMNKLQSMQCLYNVRYNVVYPDGRLNTQREEFTENMFCFTDIQLDTFDNGWKKYLKVTGLSDLLTEVSLSFINRYQDTEVIGIRRLQQAVSEDDGKALPR